MFHKIINVETLNNKILKIKFENKEIKYYDMKKIIEKYNEFEILNNESIFNTAKVDQGGYGIIWTDEIDISGEELYVNGVDNL